jgi:hypothetical protein
MSRQPKREINSTPATATATPTGVKSNIPKASPPSLAWKLEMMMFGGVPIRVVRPPNKEPKAIGISKTEGAVPRLRAILKATGRKRAKAPILLMKAETTATELVRIPTWICGWSPTLPIILAMASMMPEFWSALPTTETAITVITAG